MENLRRQSYSESLKTTLNCYQLTSADSLSGPSGYPALAAQLRFEENKLSPPIPQRPLIQIPLLMPNDTSTQRSETTLGGERISCFVVGGEKRLCLPQILTTVLREFSISEINRTCAELHIYCSRCSPDQLDILKVLRILPFNTTQCGLITKTDAERLVSALGVEYHLNAKHDLNNDTTKGIHVYHECFGRGDGIFYPDLYISPDATCIACMDCRITFSPKRFVAHSHRGLEKRTCHWGFDPDHWRSYLLLPKETDSVKRPDLEKSLNVLKARFDVSNPDAEPYSNGSPTSIKRRLGSDYETQHIKRLKDERDETPFLSQHRAAAMYFGFPFGIRPSAFKPWSPTLPIGIPSIPDHLAAHEEALVKALGPMMHERRLLPGYLQFGPPAVVPQQDAVEWANALQKSQVAPNITLAPAEQQKRTASIVMEKERRETSSKSSERDSCRHIIKGEGESSSGRRNFDKHLSPRISDEPPLRGSLSSITSPENLSVRHVSEDSHHPTELHSFKKDALSSDHHVTDPGRANENGLKRTKACGATAKVPYAQSKHEHSVVEATDRHDSTKHHTDCNKVPPLIAINNAVAAASAMLELSSSVKDKKFKSQGSVKRTNSLETLSTESKCTKMSAYKDDKSIPCASSHKLTGGLSIMSNGVPHLITFPHIVPLEDSHKHFKWSFRSSSFIISTAGTQELKMFHSLLENSDCSEAAKEQLLHEVVKMKSRSEEKLDIQERVKRDIESKMECLKITNKLLVQESADAKEQVKLEMERMRNEHNQRLQEANEALAEFSNQLEKPKRSPCESTDATNPQHKLIEKLNKLIADQEAKLDHLQGQVFEEREKRTEAVAKVEELLGSPGRMPFLMDGALSSIIRGSRNLLDEGNGGKPNGLSMNGRKSLETIASSMCRATSVTSSASSVGQCDDDIIDVTTIPKTHSSLHLPSSKDSGIQDMSSV
ncbi:unnamed protein product [Clavelina lepadiformis]|uniref:c-SKI SMAD4-binding domain-containing protein n=1 Tax=Clavelina lepadiformis TaxID=159417 RepID=A0ABP0GHV8_CLALP